MAGRLAAYLFWCMAGMVVGYIAAVIVGLVLTFANVSTIAAAIVGPDAAFTVIGLIGNAVFAGIAGFAAASAFQQISKMPDDLLIGLTVVGFIATVVAVYGLAPALDAFAPGFAADVVALGGLAATAVITVIMALFVAAVVGAVGVAFMAGRPAEKGV